MLALHTIDKRSPFLGEECALCKDPFAPGEEIVVCPEDGSRHHHHCWVANGNACAAYGCDGRGQIREELPTTAPGAAATEDDAGSRWQRSWRNRRPHVVTRPTSSFGCGQTCVLFAIAIAIVFFSVGCFGLWAIADYLMLNVWDMPYRAPFSGFIIINLLF